MYANQGKPSDYQQLVNQGVDLRETIAITRYGGAGRAAKVSFKLCFGWSDKNTTADVLTSAT